MVRLSIAPMSRSASSVSWTEAKASLRYFLLARIVLHEKPRR